MDYRDSPEYQRAYAEAMEKLVRQRLAREMAFAAAAWFAMPLGIGGGLLLSWFFG